MTEPKVTSVEVCNASPHLSQGDIFKDVEYIEKVKVCGNDIEISKIIFPYVVILTQECDLLQDYKTRSKNKIVDGLISSNSILMSVLVAPLYNEDHVLNGSHLSELKRSMATITKYKNSKFTTDYNRLIQNETPRYHYLNFGEDSGISPVVIDFKHYFSLDTDYLYDIKKEKFVCKILELYREDISHRFASYLSRVGLPDEKNCHDLDQT